MYSQRSRRIAHGAGLVCQLRRDQAYGCGALYVQPRTETTGQAYLVYVSGRNSRALHQQVHSRAHSGLGKLKLAYIRCPELHPWRDGEGHVALFVHGHGLAQALRQLIRLQEPARAVYHAGSQHFSKRIHNAGAADALGVAAAYDHVPEFALCKAHRAYGSGH